MNFKRYKPRRKVRCQLCTDNRDGNSAKQLAGRGPAGQRARALVDKREFEKEMGS